MNNRPTWPPAQVDVHGSVAAMDIDPDLDLLVAWRGGDKKAAGILLGRYHKTIRGAIITKVRECDVDDLVQKVILAMLEGREQFRGDAKLKTYAMRITRNVIADHYRRRRPTEPLELSVRDHGEGLSTLLANKQEHRLLLEALRSIAIDDQFLLELHYWEKMTGPQLAQVFECPESKIRHRLARAKQRLRDEVEKIADEHRELADTLTDLDAWAMRLREALEPDFRPPQPRK